MIGIVHGAIGIIQSINMDNYTATVKLLDYENRITGEMQILSSLSYKNKIVQLPKVGSPVFCLFIGEQSNSGFIIGTFFSNNNKSESLDGHLVVDFNKSKLTIAEDGKISISCNELVLEADTTTVDSKVIINGATTINDNLSVTEAVSANGIGAAGSVTAKEVIADKVIERSK